MGILKRLLNPAGYKAKSQIEDSIQKMVTVNAVDRRKNVRVNYPHFGAVGSLPKVFYNDKEIPVANISVGGVCLIDSLGFLGEDIGKDIELKLIWPTNQAILASKVVGANIDKRHVQFVNTSTEIHVRLSLLLKPGFLGTKFRCIDTSSETMNIESAELWLSPTGENINFHKASSGYTLATMNYQKLEISILQESAPAFTKNSSKFSKGQELPQELLKDIIVCLSNFNEPTDAISTLILHLQKYVRLS